MRLLYLAPILALLASAGAANGASLAEKVAREVLGQTRDGRRIINDFDRYKRLAAVFRKYHDSKTLEDKELLEVLKDTGVIKGAKPKPGAAAPKPFPVPKYSGGYRWPMDAGIVSSEFGPRWGKMHQGVDIAADMGAPIHAIAPGEVIYAGSHITGYGNVIILRHDQNTTTTYAHNKALRAKQGDKVKAGQLIALLGSTGHSTGPHLHFEFRVGNSPVNPRDRLPQSRF